MPGLGKPIRVCSQALWEGNLIAFVCVGKTYKRLQQRLLRGGNLIAFVSVALCYKPIRFCKATLPALQTDRFTLLWIIILIICPFSFAGRLLCLIGLSQMQFFYLKPAL